MRRPRRFAAMVPLFFSLLLLAAGQALAAPAGLSPSLSPLADKLIQEAGPDVRLSTHALTGKVRYLGVPSREANLHQSRLQSWGDTEGAARHFLTGYGSLFGLSDQARELQMMRRHDGKWSFVRFRQVHSDIPVFGGEIIVQVRRGGEVVSAHAKVLPIKTVNTVSAVAPDKAIDAALSVVVREYGEKYGLVKESLRASLPELWIYNPVLLGINRDMTRLVWRVEVTPAALLPIRELVLVDASRGSVALHFNQVPNVLNRLIYDNQNVAFYGLPGRGPVRVEGQAATGITDVDNAYSFAGDFYSFYLAKHGRDSIDGDGMALVSTVRYCEYGSTCPYPNAFWEGDQMVYGAGYASAQDVVGHEMTHGVTDYESKLFYYMQSGAINESFSDIWGEFIEQTYGSVSASERWLMGQDLPDGPVRDMKNPRTFYPADPFYVNDPDRMSSLNYVCGTDDNGGVHDNSGVGNKAAYLMTDGDTFNGYTVTGLGIDKVAKIYYEVQTRLLTSAGDYADLHDALIHACHNLVGTSGIVDADCQQVENAVNATEMDQQPGACAAPEAPVCDVGEPVDLFYDDLENPSAGNWSVQTLYTPGGNRWYYPQNPNPYSGWDPTYATSGQYNFWGDDIDVESDSAIAMTKSVLVKSGAYLHFNHAYSFEADSQSNYDGGVVEYSVDGGTTWNDAGSLMTHNGYNGHVEKTVNPLAGRSAFTGESNGYLSTRLDLTSLVGKSVRFRFRIGTDEIWGANGWFIDDIRIYTCLVSVGMIPAEGTRGTEITFRGGGFGSSKGKVFLGTVALKVTSWNDDEIHATVNKPLSPGSYGVTIQPKAKGALPMTLAGSFVVRVPEIDNVDPLEGGEGEWITVTGKFLGTKKGKVYLSKDGVLKSCKSSNWTMYGADNTGAFLFQVPKKMTPGPYELQVSVTGVGTGTASFTITP